MPRIEYDASRAVCGAARPGHRTWWLTVRSRRRVPGDRPESQEARRHPHQRGQFHAAAGAHASASSARCSRLFRDQGINRTGMDQLCAVAQVSTRTAYQHFTSKDGLVAEYLRRFDPDVTTGVFDRTDLTSCERLLAALEPPVPLRTRLQVDHRRAPGRHRPRSRRHRPRTARAAPRRRRGSHPGPQHRLLPHCPSHRRRPRRQSDPHQRLGECTYDGRVTRERESPGRRPSDHMAVEARRVQRPLSVRSISWPGGDDAAGHQGRGDALFVTAGQPGHCRRVGTVKT
jgi:hypothetical protein